MAQLIINGQKISSGGGSSTTVIDDKLDVTSVNPVQNKIITEELNKKLNSTDIADWAKTDTKPEYTYTEVGADPVGSASAAKTESKSYTDEKIAALINGAPTTLDTLKEVADAMAENESVVEALEAAIGSKSIVTLSRSLTSGTKIATITINGTAYDIYCETNTDTTYSAATTTKAGLMSAADKSKLDGITESADSVSFTPSLTSGTKIGTLTINGAGVDLYCQTNTNTDTKVTNTLNTTAKAYVTGTTSAKTNTGTQVFDTGVYLGTTAGELVATTFTGSLNGNANTATKLNAQKTIDGVKFDGSANIIHYTTCSTAAATAAKTAACTGFTLATGAWIAVRFAVTNTAASPTLNINNTGAKAIRYRDAIVSANVLTAGRTYLFIYNGASYELVGDLDTSSKVDVLSADPASPATGYMWVTTS